MQGPQILLFDSEHVLGRSVKDPACQFDSLNVSAKHCTIFRKRFKADESYIPHQGTEPLSADRWLVYIKDSRSCLVLNFPSFDFVSHKYWMQKYFSQVFYNMDTALMELLSTAKS